MAKISKKAVPKHYLVADTNELWQEVKNEVVSENFEEFWSENADKYTIELYVPDVVKGELLFQHTSGALKALQRANTQIETVSKAANKKYSLSISSAKVKKDIETKIENWLRSKNAKVLETRVDKINWKKIIESSTWRLPPFDSDPNKEKGFRDALILESLRNFCFTEKDINIAFVTRDNLLRKTSEKELKEFKNLVCFESLEQFSSYLKLLDEKLTTEFITAIQRKAREKFFNKQTDSGLFVTENIHSFIENEFSDKFSLPSSSGVNRLLDIAGSSDVPQRQSRWEELGDETVWIKSPEFEKLEDHRTYHWSSIVSYVQLFKYKSGGLGSIFSPQDGDINIRVLPFAVKWKADVKSDGRFHNIEFVEVEALEKTFEKPSTYDIEKYRLGDHFDE